jgi:hypothetical protein
MPYLASDIRALFEGNAWHGPSWSDVVKDLNADWAGRRVIPGVHTIYELVHHTGAWAGEVARRLGGAQPQMPPEGDFPATGTPVTNKSWEAAVANLMHANDRLLTAIVAFDDARLDQHIGATRDAPLGTGVSYRTMIAGALAHTAYHAGQAMMLRRALEQQDSA